ncbi:16S rRNA (cytosine(967)-C(5))-methyltransferase RsmB [Thiomicrospira cyclica]|uniref:16S rRNA (cytosine(967)-C(5))-methyltransferase n=1 Tax=Thiomicrospira cyclica (strain DSM 14477 / JCM 11371 / ALM1) TaxID=717773 RepID=F6DAM3_THICA|nr:16S rRNA (cytosine(967)-C(5))-methyltransferase RsmB [Thiomicrospira cyclica]AEG32279.1 sun protein [Thiomicrospira cyclica ALM1]
MSRHLALKALLQVTQHGKSLSQVMPEILPQIADRRDRAFCQNLVFGCLRWHGRLTAIRECLLDKPMRAKDEDVNSLILLALYQILYLDTPSHAAVAETLKVAQKLKKPWAKGLLNGLLRRFIREQTEVLAKLTNTPAIEQAHPQWLVDQLAAAYPDEYLAVLAANNSNPLITLRVNPTQCPINDFIDQLGKAEILATTHPASPDGLVLQQPTDITTLPGYGEGWFSVQDIAAQQAAALLAPQPGERILDACAAPGGKTTHLLEYANNKLDLLALDKDPDRLRRVAENLARLQLKANLKAADAANLETWWDGKLFDRILLDAPCSATGIIRRHPDIKLHRRPEDIAALQPIQAGLLHQLWSTLKPGGHLLYATCSVLPQENSEQISAFLAAHPDAQLVPITPPMALTSATQVGWQILPGQAGMDGFYYALLAKR